jgi:hypothetical protein
VKRAKNRGLLGPKVFRSILILPDGLAIVAARTDDDPNKKEKLFKDRPFLGTLRKKRFHSSLLAVPPSKTKNGESGPTTAPVKGPGPALRPGLFFVRMGPRC